jgi:hypothetical protein
MRTISILGSGWLAKLFSSAGYNVNSSTTKPERRSKLDSIGVKGFVLNITNLEDSISLFF